QFCHTERGQAKTKKCNVLCCGERNPRQQGASATAARPPRKRRLRLESLVALAAAGGGLSMACLTASRVQGPSRVRAILAAAPVVHNPRSARARQQWPQTGGAKPRAARRRLGSGGLRESLAPILPERGP